MKTRTIHAASLADCLSAAKADAERLHGQGPVPVWRPRRAWKAWALGAATAALVLGGAIVFWQWSVTPVAAPAKVAAQVAPAARPDTLPAPAAGVPAVRPTTAEPLSTAPAPASTALPVPAGAPTAPVAMPGDMEAWALMPEPMPGASARVAEQPRAGLMNVPAAPDDNDATPGGAEDPSVVGGAEANP